MPNVIRVIAPQFAGNNALTDTDPSHYSLFTDQNNVLIKEFARGSGQLGIGNEEVIYHNLGYVPFYLAYGEVATGRYRAINWYSLFSGVWRTYADDEVLVIRNENDASFQGFKYYIFYDQIV